MGFFGFGIALHDQLPWIGPIMFQSILGFGLSFLNIAVYGYITDCLRDHAPEAFASINLRNIYSFGTLPRMSGFDNRYELLHCGMDHESGTS